MPTIKLTPENKFNDRLEIKVNKKYVVFDCFIDNTGNIFKIKKEDLRKVINDESNWKSCNNIPVT